MGNSLATGEFPSQRPVTQSFDIFFDLRLNKLLSKQSRRRWFEMPLHSLWHHCNVHQISNSQKVTSYHSLTDKLINTLYLTWEAKIWSVYCELRPRQNGRRFADNVFKCIILNENVWISLKISVKFVPKVPINNIHALVQILAWRRSGDKPLSEPMVVSLLTHICVTRPQWVKLPSNLYHKSHLGRQ